MKAKVQKAKRTRPRPFLRWAGSKRQVIGNLANYVDPTADRYIEPFAGSACLFFHVLPTKAIIGDINNELILTYKEVKYRLPSVLYYLKRFGKGKKEYLKVRAQDPRFLTKPHRAARFIYLNRNCFNGLYRTNRLGKFNVPYGGKKAGDLPSAELLQECAKAFRSTKFVAGDFAKVLNHVKNGDFVYLDPPFRVRGRRVFREYAGTEFSIADFERLRTWLRVLDKRHIPFLVSYAESAEADMLAQGYFKRVVTVRRHIAGFASKRKSSREYLISNFDFIGRKRKSNE